MNPLWDGDVFSSQLGSFDCNGALDLYYRFFIYMDDNYINICLCKVMNAIWNSEMHTFKLLVRTVSGTSL